MAGLEGSSFGVRRPWGLPRPSQPLGFCWEKWNVCANRTCQAKASEKSGTSLPVVRCCFWQVTLQRPEHGGRETPAVCRRWDLRDD